MWNSFYYGHRKSLDMASLWTALSQAELCPARQSGGLRPWQTRSVLFSAYLQSCGFWSTWCSAAAEVTSPCPHPSILPCSLCGSRHLKTNPAPLSQLTRAPGDITGAMTTASRASRSHSQVHFGLSSSVLWDDASQHETATFQPLLWREPDSFQLQIQDRSLLLSQVCV